MRLTFIEHLKDLKRAVMDDFDKGYNYCLDELQIIAPEHTTYIEEREVETDNGPEVDCFCHYCQGYWSKEKYKDFTHCPHCGGLILDEASYLYINEGIKPQNAEESADE